MPKRWHDLPQFRVTSVKVGATHATGYSDYALTGTFNTLEGVRNCRCWLLFHGQRKALIGDLQIKDSAAGLATFQCSETMPISEPAEPLVYLDSYWQAYQVWMVLDPGWPWSKVSFEASDALAHRVTSAGPAHAGSGRDQSWIVMRQAEPGSSARDGETLVLGGWDHQHCELCTEKITAGQTVWCDDANHWLCDGCYTAYVLTRNLAFIDDLG